MKKSSAQGKSESQFLLIMGTLVVLMGVPAVFSFLRNPSAEKFVAAKVESRSPASVGTPSPLTDGITGHSMATPLLKFDCSRKELKEEVTANYVRLVGTPCKATEDLEITNVTNGFSASVIFTKDNKFTTDFIDLREGENNLEFTAVQADGTKISRVFKITRRTPAMAASPN